MLWTEGRSAPRGVKEEPVFHSTPGLCLKMYETSDEMPPSKSEGSLLTRAAVQCARNSFMWSVTPPDEVIALRTVGNKPRYLAESLILNFFLMSRILMMSLLRESKDQPLTSTESWYDSKPSLTIHDDALYFEAKWHGWIYYSYPVLRDQSLYYIFAELRANKMCRCVMDCRHHLKMISLAIERLALRHSSINSNA